MADQQEFVMSVVVDQVMEMSREDAARYLTLILAMIAMPAAAGEIAKNALERDFGPQIKQFNVSVLSRLLSDFRIQETPRCLCGGMLAEVRGKPHCTICGGG